MSSRLQNQSCRPSPVVWKKHRSKWSQRLGSRFFGPLFENGLLHFLGTNSPHVRVHERRPKHEKLKNVNPQQPSHPSPPPFHGNTFFDFPLLPHILVPPDWFEISGFFSRTDYNPSLTPEKSHFGICKKRAQKVILTLFDSQKEKNPPYSPSE